MTKCLLCLAQRKCVCVCVAGVWHAGHVWQSAGAGGQTVSRPEQGSFHQGLVASHLVLSLPSLPVPIPVPSLSFPLPLSLLPPSLSLSLSLSVPLPPLSPLSLSFSLSTFFFPFSPTCLSLSLSFTAIFFISVSRCFVLYTVLLLLLLLMLYLYWCCLLS